MSQDLSSATWLLQVAREDLLEQVGMLTFARAEGYAAQDRVRTLVTGPGGGVLLATVAGSGRRAYQSIVRRVGEHGAVWVGQCSCPVGSDCKHCVAVVLTVQRRLRAAGMTGPASWESALAGLIPAERPGTNLHARTTHPVGLQFSLAQHALSPPAIRLRPLRPGKGSRWVRSGVSWRDLASPWTSREVDPRQKAVLTQLVSITQGGGYYGFNGAAELDLADLGPLAWTLLEQCQRVGISFLPGPGIREVRLAAGGVRVTLDMSREDDGGLTLRPQLDFEAGAEPSTETSLMMLLGNPPHGLAALDTAQGLDLWPTRGVVPAALGELLARRDPVQVPPSDVDRFLAHYYPTLAREFELSSADGSLPAASVVRPRLRLELTPGDRDHALQLEWAIVYTRPTAAGGTAEALLPLVRSPQDPPRDLETEADLVGDVTDLLRPLPALVEEDLARYSMPWPRPATPLTVTGHDAMVLVTRVLPQLEAHEDVEVVVHGQLPDYQEADEAPVLTIETTSEEDNDWFDLHVTVTVGGQPVPLEELLSALVRGEETMLLPSGTFFSLQVPELDALRRLIEEARELEDSPPRDGRVRITPYQAGLWEELVELGVVGRQSTRWQQSVDELLALGGADRGTARVPDGLDATLRPYQIEGFDWLSRLWDAQLGGVLADDMGLGKTMQVLAMVARGEERGDLAEGPVLVVAPTSVVGTWAQEAARFAPGLRVATITATHKRRGSELSQAIGGADLVVTSYTLLRLEAEAYQGMPWAAAVLDEAQFVKNHQSATYRAVRSLRAARRFVITGTPLENNLMDLWSMLSLSAPGLFPRPDAFSRRYRRPIESGSAAPEVMERMRRRIRPFMLRRTKGQVATELPPKIEQTLHVDLHPAHRKIYERHLARERQRVLGLLADPDRNRVAIFRALTVLRQLALDPCLVDQEHTGVATSAKITALLEQVQELAAEGHRALVFSSFTSYLALVRHALDDAGIGYSYLDGRTRDRPARIAAFREGEDPLFLISLKAGGFGLTLTEADYVFVLDPWWNPAAEAQAVDRTHRIGQTRPVNVYRLVSTDTIEEKVVALQERKRDLFATVVDSGEFRSGAITVEDIRGLLGE